MNIFGNFFNTEEDIEKVINKLKITIGSLPICVNVNKEGENINEIENKKSEEEKKVFKTVILEDGSYSTELVQEKKLLE